MKHQRLIIVTVLVLAAPAWFIADEIQVDLERKADVERCSVGKEIFACLADIEEPTSSQDLQSGKLRVWIWKSGSEFSENSDIAVVSDGNIVVDIFNLDRQAESEQFHKKYPDATGGFSAGE